MSPFSQFKIFLRTSFISIVFISFPFLPLPPATHCMSSSQIQDFLNCYCYIYTYVYINIYICTIPSAFSVAHMFSADHMGLDNQARGSSLKKTDSPSRISLRLPVALHLWAGSCENSPIYLGMPTGVFIIQVLYRGPYYWDFMGEASL